MPQPSTAPTIRRPLIVPVPRPGADRLGRHASNVRALFESTGTPFARIDYARRAVVFRQGDASDSVIHIEHGQILLTVAERNGKEAVCGLMGPGAFLGEESLSGQPERRQTATALTPATVLVVSKGEMSRLLQTRSPIADRFIAHVLARNTRLEADLTDMLLHSSEQRLARTLLVLAGYNGRRQGRGLLPNISQEIIAEMVGTTRSRVNSFIGKFKKLGFIEERGRRLKVNPSLLQVVQDDEAPEVSAPMPIL